MSGPLESQFLDSIKVKARKMGIRLTKKTGGAKIKAQLIKAIRKMNGK
jgi:hypothetical protein